MNKKLSVCLLALAAVPALAAEPAAQKAPAAAPTGEALAHTCSACHGTYGRLRGEHFVPLAGMKKQEFIASMRAFKDLKRPSSIMSHIAEGYSDSDFERMADFFAALPAEER